MRAPGCRLRPRHPLRRPHCTGSFQCDISISNENGNKINAKSVLGITLLAAAFGTCVYIEASGKDEKEAINEIEKLFNSKFGEES